MLGTRKLGPRGLDLLSGLSGLPGHLCILLGRIPCGSSSDTVFVMEPQEILALLLGGDTLSDDQAERAFDAMLEGRFDEAQIAGFLSLVQARGATAAELIGAARAMRSRVSSVAAPDDAVPLVDTAGTGGAPKTFNVSTAGAIVAAAAAPGAIRVAKHGNRSRTGRGSAEVMERLGVKVDASPAVQARCLHELGVCFCFAIHHHPAARHAAGVRRSLAFPTMFNLLGPMTNPAGADRQVMGVYDASLIDLVANSLAGLGVHTAMVLHSRDGLDELSIGAPTDIAMVRDGRVRREVVDPRELGLAHATPSQVRAGDLDDAARIVRSTLAGDPGPHHDMVLLNAAAALLVADAVDSLHAGIALAREAIASGGAASLLDRLASLSSAG